jgi:3-oxoacyl-[acyl-carrier protein] reductase
MAVGRLAEQVVIVTGGALGIGAAYCRALAKEGAAVVIADIADADARSLADELQEAGAQALAVATDVASPDATAAMADAVANRFGRIDGLINNAAMFQRPGVSRGPFEEIAVEEWDRVMAVNLRGVFLCSKAVVPHMKRQGRGKIINISSSTVHMGTSNFAHYVTSKAGVIGFTRVLARELGEHGINVNAVAPGQTLSLDEIPDDRRERYETAAQGRSLKRLETPQDLVGAIVFLCSPDSDFITGQTLVVDGGIAFS